jgi:hypothetical protein
MRIFINITLLAGEELIKHMEDLITNFYAITNQSSVNSLKNNDLFT